LGVGLIVRVPGITTPGSVSNALVSQIDLYPTVCDLVGIDRPAWLQGGSLLPVMEGARNEVQDAVFGEVTFHAAYEPQRSIRTNRWRYIRRFEDRDRPTLPNIDASPALSWLLEHSWHDRPRAQIQLYDCALDPLQMVNLAGTDDYSEIERELWERLKDWMIETNDPLLVGPVPLPIGAVVNRASATSPDEEVVSSLEV
jgi:arylsulfatase A-like enzyme